MNFDKIIDRRNTDSLKYDFAVKRGKPEGILPLWVADMDFRAPDCVLEALTEKSRHGIFGYSESGEEYFDALKGWFQESHGWEVRPEWLVKTPGVVFAISTAVRALTREGDGVIIQQPVYYPFTESVVKNDRKLVVSELVYSEGRYAIDFEDFERKIKENNVKLFILCSPHNPVGRVWTAEELTRLGDICLRHGVLVVSDEIHADFVYPGHRHIVFSSLKPEFEKLSIICTAPTKTFNLAGLQVSNIFIPDERLRLQFRREIGKTGYSQLGIMGIVACKAAYTCGRNWLEALKSYLNENLGYVHGFLKERLPQVRLIEPEGTYLVWLDFKDLGLDDDALERLIVHKAGLWLDGGLMFGPAGTGFQRINIACPRSVLEKALTQLEKAVNS
ncbi:cystathione beta-lyase [Sporobacter termitidis DSM 10068]|uniref:cysteine-S-conjugate beta-lyase n=1 Tax=Sporobacter termitidis DSM 10068 TaxID=1123282 RepID=A0A1M5Z2H2_9FIRM|nr:MalY/PatB family protein [Sporobacter termitidis]SHI18083.1 cystathione beta-lyase [Sporobacter termitidis DSM 10068]